METSSSNISNTNTNTNIDIGKITREITEKVTEQVTEQMAQKDSIKNSENDRNILNDALKEFNQSCCNYKNNTSVFKIYIRITFVPFTTFGIYINTFMKEIDMKSSVTRPTLLFISPMMIYDLYEEYGMLYKMIKIYMTCNQYDY